MADAPSPPVFYGNDDRPLSPDATADLLDAIAAECCDTCQRARRGCACPTEWQPRWVSYARSEGRDPSDPALQNHLFIGWISARWREWHAETGVPTGRALRAADHEAFDAWLDARLPEVPDAG